MVVGRDWRFLASQGLTVVRHKSIASLRHSSIDSRTESMRDIITITQISLSFRSASTCVIILFGIDSYCVTIHHYHRSVIPLQFFILGQY